MLRLGRINIIAMDIRDLCYQDAVRYILDCDACDEYYTLLEADENYLLSDCTF